jgi:hypothetical protein
MPLTQSAAPKSESRTGQPIIGEAPTSPAYVEFVPVNQKGTQTTASGTSPLLLLGLAALAYQALKK